MAYKIICQNRQANFNYSIEENVEAGIVLKGSEIKSLHTNGTSLSDSHAVIEKGEIWLLNFHISPYKSTYAGLHHDPKRPKKLLLKKSQIMRLFGKVKEKGIALIARKIYQNERGKVKVDLCLGKGKKLYDKRAAIKERDLARESRKRSNDED